MSSNETLQHPHILNLENTIKVRRMSLNIFSVLMLILYRYPKVFFRKRKQQKFIAVRKKTFNF